MALTDEESVVVNAVAGNADLSARAQRIADKLLARIERIVEHGNEQAVTNLASRMMPALLKAMGDRGNDDDLAKTFADMRAEMRDYSAAVIEQAPDVAEDVAPVGTGYAKQVRPPVIRVSTKSMRDRTKGSNAEKKPKQH